MRRGGMPGRVGRVLGAVIAALTVLPAVGARAAGMPDEGLPGPTRILIVGDSVTNGSVGDWTWRYRLWNNLTASGADVDFVGPNTGVLDPEAGPGADAVNAMLYADPDFDVDHASRWGMGFALPDHLPGDLVEDYAADVVVEDLGLNDLTWLGLSPETLVEVARRFVADVRAANPAADVVLAQLPQTWIAKTSAYNALLEDLAAELDEPDARVVVARAPTPFVLEVDTYDLAHPSATGEVKIARSVAAALAEIGVGSAPEAFPAVANGPATPPEITVRKQQGGATSVAWSIPLGATGIEVWQRRAAEAWRQVPRPTYGLGPGERAEVRVRAFKGTAVSPLFSAVATIGRAPRGW